MDLNNLLLEENEIDSDLSASENGESDDDSDEELLMVLIACANFRNLPSGRLIPRIQGYVEGVIPRYTFDEFRRTFR